MIQVEMAGPRTPRTFDIAPDEILTLADWVFRECVNEATVGGFLTTDMQGLKGWVTSNEMKLEGPYRKSCLFFFPPSAQFVRRLRVFTWQHS